jgi:putative ABC transport system permease protein
MFLALTEMRRAKLRFALLMGAVGLLAFLILFQQALTGGLVTQFIGALRNQTGAVIVLSADARENLAASNLTPDQVRAVQAVEGVAASAAVGEGTFTVSNEVSRAQAQRRDQLVDATIIGYPLGGLGAPATMVEGRLPTADGEAVASELNAPDGFDIGDVVRVEPDGVEITVVGLARDVNFSVTPTLFTSYATWEQAKGTLNPDAPTVQPSAVVVDPAPNLSADELAERIGRAVPRTDPLTRAQAEARSPGVAEVRSSFSLIIGLLWFVVLLTTGLFFLILTVQKTGPLTVLRAMGASGGKLISALIIQVVVVMIGGVVVGVGLFVGAAQAAGTGLDLRVEPMPVLRTSVLLVVLALVGTAFGALRRIRRIDPAAAVAVQGGLR